MKSPEMEVLVPEVSQQEAMMAIQNAKSICAGMGANDSEMPDLLALERDLQNGVIEPAEAKSRAEDIVASKQDYH